jgi:biopolymer transport protein ExbB
MIFAGGAIFWILVAMAVVALVTYIERFVDLRRAQIDYQDFLKGVINVLDAENIDEALAICDDTTVPVAQVVSTAIRNRAGSARVLREAVDAQGRAEVGRLDRRMAALAIIAQIAPTLGLLGSVIGFIHTVLAANSETIVSRADLLGGCMEALVAAAAGLAVSIIASVMYGSLRVRLDRMTVELEAAASNIVGYLSTRKDRES